MAFNILNHSAVPKHEILSDDEIEEIFADVDYDISQLPKIRVNDPVSKAIGAEEGQVLKITRKSETAGIFVTYRLVSGENKKDFLRSIDLLVMPTFFEGLPMSLLECMGYGAVPVITPVGSIPTVVTDHQNGLFIKVKDTDSIVEATTYLHENRNQLQLMSQAARHYIFMHFNADTYIENLNQIYSISQRQ